MEKILVIVDPLKGFLEKGSLATPEHMQYVPYIVDLISSKNFKKIIILKDEHEVTDVELDYMPMHCMAGDEESEIIPEIMAALNKCGYVDFESASYDLMFDDELEAIYNYEIFCKNDYSPRVSYDMYFTALGMMQNQYDSAHIVGFVGSVCVYNAVQDFSNMGFKVAVHEEAIGDIPAEIGGIPKDILFNHWSKVYGVEVI